MIKLKSKGYEKSEDFTVEYSEPLNIKQIALQSFSMEVSWFTISEKYNNNKFILDTGVHHLPITIPDGNYTVRGLNEYLIRLFKSFQGHFGSEPLIKFGIVEARQRIAINLKKGWVLDLRNNEFHKILGFEKEIYGDLDSTEDLEIEGDYIANISNGNDNIYIHCNVVEGSLINEFNSEVIYSFTNKNPPGSLISKEFNNLIYFPVKTGSVSRIRMRITNQDGELIDLNKGAVEYNFIPTYKDKSENYLRKIYQLLKSSKVSTVINE